MKILNLVCQKTAAVASGLMLVLFWPSYAWALPTPDSLIISLQILPAIFAVFTAFIVAIGLRFRSWLEKTGDPIKFLMRLTVVLTVAIIIAVLSLVVSIGNNKEAIKIGNAAQYFRSDPQLDQLEFSAQDQQQLWYASGLVTDVKLQDLEKIVSQNNELVLVSTSRTRYFHDSAIPTLRIGDAWVGATHLPHGEFSRYLEDLIASDPSIANRSLVVFFWASYSYRAPFHESEELRNTLKKFKQVFAVEAFERSEIVQFMNQSAIFQLSVEAPNGELRKAEEVYGVIKYQVRRDTMAFDERQVAFPKMMELLSPLEMVDVLDRPEVEVILPFNSSYRSRRLQEYYSYRYYAQIPSERLHLLDFNSPNLSEQIEQMAEVLRGKPYVIIGMAKHDWIYMGLDLPYTAWRQYGRETKKDFQYLGASIEAARVAAIISGKNTLVNEIVRKAFRAYELVVAAVPPLGQFSMGVLILMAGIMLRLLLLPMGYIEAHSRFLRGDIKAFGEYRKKVDPSYRFVGALESTIAEQFGCRKSLEIVGGLLSLMLVLPFYGLFVAATPYILKYDSSFLWLSNITNPSWSMALLLNIVILTKIVIGRMGKYPTPFTRRDLGLIPLFALFQILLAQIPATILIYAIGVIGLQTLVEIFVRLKTWGVIAKSMLQQPTTVFETNNHAVNLKAAAVQPLASCWTRQDIGNKARRLGRLSNYQTKLFAVPGGVVLPAASLFAEGESILSLWPDRKPAVHWAVRSCGLAEDGDLSSMAGRYETRLGIAEDGLDSAFREVAASFGGNEDAEGNAIIIQEMVDADISGVLFTVSPENSGLSLGEYGPGLAEELVSGQMAPTQFTVGRYSGEVTLEATSDLEFGIEKLDLSKLFQQLFVAGRLIEDLFGAPQDIEWAYDGSNDQLYIIQSRDITATLYDLDVSAEQQKALLQASEGSVPARKAQWSRGALAEVVSQPSPFASTLLSRLYAGQGALGVAMRNMGYNYSVTQSSTLNELFGELFERNQQGWKSFSVRNLWWNQRLQKSLASPSGASLVESIERRLIEAEKEVEAEISSSGRVEDKVEDDISVSLSYVMDLVSRFSSDIYPLGFEATTLTGLLMDSGSAGADETDSAASTSLRTRTAELYRDMSRVKSGELAEEAFVKRWGHRGPSEYDLAKPTYGEDISLIVGGPTEISSPSVADDSENQESLAALSLTQRLIHAKENAKDLSLRFLHSVLKPALLQLEEKLSVSSGFVHFATLEELERLASNPDSENVKNFSAQVEERRLRWEKMQAIDLGEQVSLYSLEKLEPGLEETTVTATSGLKGKMISAVREFKGPLVIIDEYDKSEIDALEPGFIVLTRNLTPDLVSLFGRAVGCISEKGGMLSHAAIVGRELDFPILTGIAIGNPQLQANRVVHVLKDGTISV